MSSVISTIVSSHYIPPTGGTIPPNETTEEFNNRQRKYIYESTPFKITMVFLGFTILFMVVLGYRYNKIEGRSEEMRCRDEARPRPILKVSRSKITPIEAVEDPKPQVRMIPQLNSTVPPASLSPPIQLVKRGPVIQNIPRVQAKVVYN
jgi:hypothetical protein